MEVTFSHFRCLVIFYLSLDIINVMWLNVWIPLFSSEVHLSGSQVTYWSAWFFEAFKNSFVRVDLEEPFFQG